MLVGLHRHTNYYILIRPKIHLTLSPIISAASVQLATVIFLITVLERPISVKNSFVWCAREILFFFRPPFFDDFHVFLGLWSEKYWRERVLEVFVVFTYLFRPFELDCFGYK